MLPMQGRDQERPSPLLESHEGTKQKVFFVFSRLRGNPRCAVERV
jgi:hypothetical protein